MLKKLFWGAAAVALLAFGLPVHAQEGKPVISVAISGYQELIEDLDYIGELAGKPGAGRQLDAMSVFATQGRGLDGIDKKRPWGGTAIAGPDGSFKVLIFVPVTDMSKVMATLAVFTGEADDAGDGVWELAAGQQSVFVKEHNGWAFIGQNKEVLEDLPNDPLPMLGGLNEQYDIAVQASVQALPEPLREQAVDQLRMGIEAGMSQKDEGETEAQFEMRKALAQHQLDAMSRAINEFDRFTVGWTIDRPGKQVYLDMLATVLPGTESAKQMAIYKPTTSKLGGLLDPDAIFTMHSTTVVTEEYTKQSTEMLDALKGQVSSALAGQDGLNEDQRKLAEMLINDVIELSVASMKEGPMSAGAVVTGEGPISAVVGGNVDGSLLEEKVKKWIAMGEKSKDFPEVKYNVAEYEGVRFHTANVQVPPGASQDEQKAVQTLFGGQIDFTLGVGEDVGYFAIGPNGIGAIKQVMDKSKSASAKTVPPMTMSLALGKLLRLASKLHEGAPPELAKAAETLEKSGADHFKIDMTSIENGLQYRILAEEGVIKAAAVLGQSQNSIPLAPPRPAAPAEVGAAN